MSPQKSSMGGIAGKINWLWVRTLFSIFFWFNLLFLFVVAYTMGGIELITDVRALIQTLRFLWLPLFSLEFAVLIWQALYGRRKIRRRLRPLYEVADLAEELGGKTKEMGTEKFLHLESAISQMEPRQEERLTTGDSDLHAIEQAVNNLLDRTRETYRQQSRFVSDVSHELRTPIAVFQGYINMLDRWGKEDEKVLNEAIQALQSESLHMQRLVEQLLFLARGDIGQTQLNYSTFNLVSMMQEVLEESSMIDENHKYKEKNPEAVAVEVSGDLGLLKQVFRIMVDNAAKYSPPESEITLDAGKNEAGRAYFSVQDSGQGIAESDLPHIFDRFYRSDASRTKSTGGTGLGLSIAKQIVEKHGGHFDVISWENVGTRVTVVL